MKAQVYVKPRRRDYSAAAEAMHARNRSAPNGSRQRREIDAAPIMAERKRMEALRQHKGLVSAWELELKRIEPALRSMASALMAEIVEWLTRRPSRTNWSLA